MLLNFEELFKPYEADGCTVDLLLTWLLQQGGVLGFGQEVISLVMIKTFTEIKNGRSFLGKCDCGCSLDNVHTQLNHYLCKRCQEVGNALQKTQRLALEEQINQLILAHIHADNEAYIAEACPNGLPRPKEAEIKWQKLLVEKERQLQKRELLLIVEQNKLKTCISKFYRKQQESQIRVPRWKIWKRRSEL